MKAIYRRAYWAFFFCVWSCTFVCFDLITENYINATLTGVGFGLWFGTLFNQHIKELDLILEQQRERIKELENKR